jgi:(2S)-methylsuccinyl-CoA dehydrogenase
MNNSVTTEAIRNLLSLLRADVSQATSELALRCASNGQINAVQADRFQVPSFELAWANAELFAAENGLAAYESGKLSLLDDLLLRTFAAEMIGSVRGRLELINAELGRLDTAIEGDPDWRQLRMALTTDAFIKVVSLWARDPDALAAVPMDQEHALMRDQFTRFAVEVVAPLAEKIHRHDLTLPEDELLRPLREMGVFGLSIPESFGGSATETSLDNVSMVVVTEALSQASLGAAGSLITRPEILARALIIGGTETQKAHWLPQIAAGEPLCAIAITEPDHGSDVAGLTLRATRAPGGWLLNGAKTWCTFAGKAGLLMVVARTSPDRTLGHRGLSLLLVEKPSSDGHVFEYRQEDGGLLAGRAIPTIGYRGMHSYDLSFQDIFVPDDHVIGGEAGLGQGFYYTMAGMIGGRMQTAARACGVMRAALLAALRYAEDRKVFGAPLLNHPLTAAKLARMAARYVASRYLTYTVARTLNDAGRADASLIKLFACRSAEMITRDAMQLHGGMGYAEEAAVSRYFVDARVLSIFEGAEETLALKVIAREMLEKAAKAVPAIPNHGMAQ